VRYAWGDAISFFMERLEGSCVDELHVYHPQPYYEVEDRSKRMLTPAFLARAWRVLRPAGELFLQTDNPYYWRYLLSVVPRFFRFEERRSPWADAPRGRTRREIVARSRGLEVFRGSGVRLDDLPPDEVERLGRELPAPDFDADKPPFRKASSSSS